MITQKKEWTVPELLDAAGADKEAREAFAAGPVMLFHGGWQSWSPCWELAPGESFPKKVRLFPDLYAQSAAPWELLKEFRRLKKGWASGSFIMYLRAGDHYLVLAAEGESPPVVYTVDPPRQRVRAGIYGESGAKLPVKIFCVRGIFALKDRLASLYNQGEAFRRLEFLGERPGGYASWYNHYTEINEEIILHDLEELTKRENLIKLLYLDRKKPAVFQIDDGWQKAVGDWEVDTERFPRGLRTAAEKIEAAGMIPGLWLAPFIITKKARFFREKPQWLLRDKKGRLVHAGWNPHWDGVFYCLDISREDVLEYLDGLMDRVRDEWGFRYIKLDFLYGGFLGASFSGGAAEVYEKACGILTAERKGKAAYLGCGLPLGASFRHFPLSRIGTDTRETWDWPAAKLLGHLGRPSAILNLRDTLARSFMNGTIYKNDPDVVFLRTKNCTLTETEKELIAVVNFMLAGQIMLSDDVEELTKEDIALTRRMAAVYDQLEGDEYGAVMTAQDVYRLESRSGKTGGIINLSDKAVPLPAEHPSAWIIGKSGGTVPPHGVTVFRR